MGDPVVEFAWHDSAVPAGLQVTQVRRKLRVYERVEAYSYKRRACPDSQGVRARAEEICDGNDGDDRCLHGRRQARRV